MKNTLLITSSPRGDVSYSSKVASELAKDLGGNVTVRELWRNPPAPIDENWVTAVFTPEADRTPEQQRILGPSDELIAELFAADTIVIAAGLINFGMPASLKTWIDLVSRKDVTFRYDETGPEGLVTGKRVILVLASGAVYSSGPMTAMNHLEPPLRSVLSFLGIKDIETVWIEGVAFGPDALTKALSDARSRSQELVAHVA